VITVFIDTTHRLEAVDGNTTQGRQVVALDAIMRANEGIATMLSGLAAATTTDDLAPFVPGFAKVTPAISRFVSYASQDQIHFFELALAASDTRLGSGVLLSLTQAG
jgi:hypothetical protein